MTFVPAHRIGSSAEALAVAHELAGEFAVQAAQRDRDRRLPHAEIDRFSQSGLWGITVPKAYGGPGLSFAVLCEVIATISAADPSIGQIPQNHLAALDTIRNTGSEEQKRLWLGRAAEGYRFGNAFSEAGSRHVGAFQTTLRPSAEGGFLVNGEKFYATGALFAHFVQIGAVDEEGRTHLAIAPRGAPGLTVIDDWSGFGQRTTASGKVTLENVRVEVEGIIPAYLSGKKPSTNGCVSQIIQAAIDAGIARGALADTIRFVRTLSRPWIDSGQDSAAEDIFIISQIGDLETRLHTAEALLEEAAIALDAILEEPTEANVAETTIRVAEAKVVTTEIALLAGSKLHEIAGTRSVLAEHNLDRHWRNARTHTLHDPARWKYFHIGNYVLNGVKPPRHAWS